MNGSKGETGPKGQKGEPGFTGSQGMRVSYFSLSILSKPLWLLFVAYLYIIFITLRRSNTNLRHAFLETSACEFVTRAAFNVSQIWDKWFSSQEHDANNTVKPQPSYRSKSIRRDI